MCKSRTTGMQSVVPSSSSAFSPQGLKEKRSTKSSKGKRSPSNQTPAAAEQLKPHPQEDFSPNKKRRVRGYSADIDQQSTSTNESESTEAITKIVAVESSTTPATVKAALPILRINIPPYNNPRETICSDYCQYFNFGDPLDFASFLDRYCVSNCSHVIRTICRSVENHNLYFPEYLELDGVKSIIYYWSTTFAAVPDGIFQVLREPKVRIFSDGSSLVSCRFQFEGTQTLNLVTDLSSTIIVMNPSDTTGSGILAFQVEGENRQVRDVAPTPTLMLSSVRDSDHDRLLNSSSALIQVTGTLSFYFNNEQRIYRMETIHD